MAVLLDLDKRIAERSEEPHKVAFLGEEWELPARLPMAAAQGLARGDIERVIALTFGVAVGDAAAEGKKGDAAQLAYASAVTRCVERLAPRIDRDLMEAVLDDLYDMGEKKGKKAKKDPAAS